MKIALDIDGVVADIIPLLHRLAEKQTGKNIDLATLVTPSAEDCWGVDTEKIFDELLFMIDEILPSPDALKGITQLKRQGHKLCFATARRVKAPTIAWLEKNKLSSIPVVWTSERMERVDVLLDDSPKKLLRLRDCYRYGFLLTQFYNKSCCNYEKLFQRVDCWNDFLDTIDNITTEGGIIK